LQHNVLYLPGQELNGEPAV